MNGEPTRLVDDSSVGDELRQRLTREAATPPYKYDFEKGLVRLRAAIAADSPDARSRVSRHGASTCPRSQSTPPRAKP